MRQSFEKAPYLGAFFVCAILILFGVTPFAFASSCAPLGVDEYAWVDRVFDGDTLRLKDGRKVRVIGINAPEKDAGLAAKQATDYFRQAVGRRIGLVWGLEQQDKYGRLLAHIYNEQGVNVSTRMLEAGMAVALFIPPNMRLADCYGKAELQAKHAEKGLWGKKQYSAMPVSALKAKVGGYYVIRGVVNDIVQGKKIVWLSLEGRVFLRMDKRVFDAFLSRKLLNESIELRGTLFKSRYGYSMSIAHESLVEFVH